MSSKSISIQLPQHVEMFLQKQAPGIAKGITHIQSLETEDDFVTAAAQLQGAEQAIRIVRGYLYRTYQKKCSDGRNFLNFLSRHGVSKSTAYDYMYETEVFDRLKDEESCTTIAALSATRVRALRHLDEEDLNAFVQGEVVKGITLPEAEKMAPKDISETLSQTEETKLLREQVANLEADLDTQATENDQLRARLNKERVDSPMPDFVVVTRHEADALSQKSLLCLDDLSRLMDDLINLNSDPHASAEMTSYIEMASTTLLIHLNGIQAKTSQILNRAMDQLPPALTSNQVNARLLYSEDEVDQAIQEREMLVREHEQDKRVRENQREANKPRGRGRPKKDQ